MTDPTSDVTRFRGVLVAAIAAAVAVIVAAVALSAAGISGALSGSPGPLALPHDRAQLACSACHDGDRAPAADACARCHGPHPSTRRGHAELAARGALACWSCHRIHRDNAGVALWPDGRVQWYRPGAVHEVEAPPALAAAIEGVAKSAPDAASRPTFIPIVSAGACAACHDPRSPRDPIAACVVAGTEPLGAHRPTACFDEHRRVGESRRDAAWGVARELSALAPPPGPGSESSGAGVWLAAGVIAGLLAWLLPATIRRARRRRARDRARDAALVQPPRELRLPTIDTSTCIGCYACVDACPYDVLEVRHYVAVLARPADCCGLMVCEQRCPNGSLVMGDGQPVASGPAVTESLESRDVPGVYLAGDVTGLPLIKNAINQGAFASRQIAKELAKEVAKEAAQAPTGAPRRDANPAGAPRRDANADPVDVVDVAIVGAGPAGISAALAAKAEGLRYVVLEQHTVAASIRSFPRGKLVFDQPLELPVIGDLWLAEATKEELSGNWLRLVRREQLAIREGVRVTNIAPLAPLANDAPARAPAFDVRTSDKDGGEGTVRARRVIVAIGRRGTPRPLPAPVPAELADRVFYSLADARSFAGQRVLVVGLGDVAMEAAVALSEQRGTEVIVSYRGPEFQRGKARNIAAVQRRVAAGAVRLLFETEVARIEPGRAILSSPTGEIAAPCDAIFALIGSIPPNALLRRFGLMPAETTDS